MTRSRGNKANDLLQPNFRDASGSPPNLGNASAGTIAPAPSQRSHSFTVSTSEAGSRNDVTRGESAASFNDPTNHGDDHAKYDVLPCFLDPSLTSRRRPHSVASIPASPAGENRQVVRQPGETGISFTADDLARLLGSKFDAADRAAFDAAFAEYRK